LWLLVFHHLVLNRIFGLAAGTVVNCDYFPVHINSLPVINGVQWTAQQLFEHFRLNINQFVNTNIASFYPYNNDVVNDVTLWHSNNPLTSILHLDMIQDGSVIISKYTSSTDNCQMIASTLNTPLDGNHPVSGNRSWGIMQDPNGGYNFYTSGVDRITTNLFEIGDNLMSSLSSSGFEEADALWRTLQTKMMMFINSNGGNAGYYSNNETILRPDWFIIKRYLRNEISLQQLRDMLGC
jgi:hypothetical protein